MAMISSVPIIIQSQFKCSGLRFIDKELFNESKTRLIYITSGRHGFGSLCAGEYPGSGTNGCSTYHRAANASPASITDGQP
jgi:hypothetical protein